MPGGKQPADSQLALELMLPSILYLMFRLRVYRISIARMMNLILFGAITCLMEHFQGLVLQITEMEQPFSIQPQQVPELLILLLMLIQMSMDVLMMIFSL